LALLAPFEPFSRILAPIVRYFWGEIFLHYPYHLGLASRLFRRTDMWLPIFLEGFLIGVTAYGCRQLLSGHPFKPRQAFSETFRRYPATAAITLVSAVALVLCVQLALVPMRMGLSRLPSLWTQSPLTVSLLTALITVTLAAALEALFIFAVPACVLENRFWIKAVWRSFQIGGRSYGPIFLTLWVVSLCYLPVILLRHGSMGLSTGPWPEAVLLVYVIRILASWGLGALFAVWGTTYLIRTAGNLTPQAEKGVSR